MRQTLLVPEEQAGGGPSCRIFVPKLVSGYKFKVCGVNDGAQFSYPQLRCWRYGRSP